MSEIITRPEAVALGLTRYFDGKPCRHGHVSGRWVSGGTCCECQLAYQRKIWRDPVKSKLMRQKQEPHRKNRQHTEEFRKKSREYYAANRARMLANAKRSQSKKRDKICEKSKSRSRRITDLLVVLRSEMPDLIKEFNL
jgi:hypothetical protein